MLISFLAGARSLRRALCAAALLCAVPAAIAASAGVDSIVVRFTDAAANGAVLPAALQDSLAGTLETSFAVSGRTRDGAFTLQLAAPLDVDAARAAINRIRLDPNVLYANVAATPAVPASTGRATDRLIVKYRDRTQVALSRAGFPLDSSRIATLASLAGQAIAWRRNAHDGGNVLQMMQRLPIAEVEAIAARIAEQPDVDYAQPDYIRTAQAVPTDPCYASPGAGCGTGYQWDLFDPVAGINMPNAWDITTGSANINVAVIDTGALFNHPDLAGRFVGGYDMISDCAVANDAQPGPCTFSPLPYSKQNPPQAAFTSVDADGADPGDWVSSAENAPCKTSAGASVPCSSPVAAAPPPAPYYDWFEGCLVEDSSWHGTHVAGTIGAIPNNGIGIAGINWVSKIVPVRVLGKCGGYTSDIANAIVWAAGGAVSGVPNNPNPARVESISLGGSGSCDPTTQTAIDTAVSLGTVVVVAAGNSNANANSSSPANCNGVITVAATTRFGLRARYSNYGSMVEIAAPGGNASIGELDIISTLNSGITSPNPTGYNYVQYAGTSMATPHVSGVVSLMLSVNPSLTPAQVVSKIQTTARAFPATGSACSVPVPQANACNCTTALCGSGIIDAAAAVASAAGGASSASLASSANPASAGVTVTFTATVTGNNPTGTVNFKDNGVSIAACASQPLAGAGNTKTAQCATSTLAVGVHPIVATYGGDAGNPASSSATLSQTINSALGTTLASSQNPANAGAPLTLTATVTGSNPFGMVSFRDAGVPLAGCSAVILTGTGNARSALCTTSSLTPGTHSLTAAYLGDKINPSSTSAPLSQVINGGGQGPSSTAVASNQNPSTVGASITFTATVTGSNPTGTVNFKDGVSSIAGCAAQSLTGSGNSRAAQCTTSSLAAGAHNISGVYGGDAGNIASTSPVLVQTVNAATGSTTLASSANPATAGIAVTLTATVVGVNPTGTVNFKDNGVSIGGCGAQALSGTGNTRTAQCTTSALTTGTHPVVATYSGDAGNVSTSSVQLAQVINPAGAGSSTTALSSSANPVFPGFSLTITATVVGTNPTGTVNFQDNGVSIAGCSAQALAGSGNTRTAQCTTSRLAQGTHPITGVYGGDSANGPSTSPVLSQKVGKF